MAQLDYLLSRQKSSAYEMQTDTVKSLFYIRTSSITLRGIINISDFIWKHKSILCIFAVVSFGLSSGVVNDKKESSDN